MTATARRVLADAEATIADLRTATSEQWRPRWVGLLAMLRGVGHALHAVDRRTSPAMARAIDAALPAMQRDPVFSWLVDERNAVLKTYSIAARRDVTFHITKGFESQALVAGETRPPPSPPEGHATRSEALLGGHFAGDDPAHAAAKIAQWWHQQLDAVDADAARS